MKLSTITNQVPITNNNLPTNIFLTNYNNIIMLLGYMNTITSFPVGVSATYSSPTLTISSHTRQYIDGNSISIPSGSVTTTGKGYVCYNNGYSFEQNKPTKIMVVGYWDGTTFTPYKIGNI